ncbi:MAG: YceD family protein [Microthrixaceae bacterium]
MNGTAASATGGVEGLRFRVLELRRRPGDRITESRTISSGALSVGEVAVAGEPASVEVVLEAISGGVRATGSVDFRWTGPCRRCLEEATGRERVDFVELFVDHPESYVGDHDSATDPQPIRDGWVDLGTSVRDAMALGLPLAPLCRSGCGGPDPESNPVGLQGATPESESPGAAPPDPRWAALADLDLGEGGDGGSGTS